jgi:uncharacterized membrane protein
LTPGAYLLVIVSAVTHAYWNFLLKRSRSGQIVVELSKIVEAFMLAPFLIAGYASPRVRLADTWILPLVGSALVLINYLALAAAYRRGELSVVYPISRGGVLVFLPPLAFVSLGERLTVLGWTALALIVLGIAMLQVPSFTKLALTKFWGQLRASATVYALVAAFIAACYTVWDKRAIQVLTPLTYFAAYTVILGVAYAVTLPLATRTRMLSNVWREEWGIITAVAVLNSGSYLLALAALQTGQASYVIALRQLSIAVGAMLGCRLLGEAFPPPRRLGVVLIVCGCVLLGLTR